MRLGRNPAMIRFIGVRKVVECVDPQERPRDGTEVSYNDLEFDSLKDVKRFADGLSVWTRCDCVLTVGDCEMPPVTARCKKKPQRRQRGKEK
jgi:hypothetical protein